MHTCEAVRVELQIAPKAKIFSKARTIGDLKKQFNKNELQFIKYVYLDPQDGLLKAVNPPDNSPLVENAYITVSGNLKEIIKLSDAAAP